jgi:hypothetical protein
MFVMARERSTALNVDKCGWTKIYRRERERVGVWSWKPVEIFKYLKIKPVKTPSITKARLEKLAKHPLGNSLTPHNGINKNETMNFDMQIDKCLSDSIENARPKLYLNVAIDIIERAQ